VKSRIRLPPPLRACRESASPAPVFDGKDVGRCGDERFGDQGRRSRRDQQTVPIGEIFALEPSARPDDAGSRTNDSRSIAKSVVESVSPFGPAAVTPLKGIDGRATPIVVRPHAHLDAVLEMDLAPLVTVARVGEGRYARRGTAAPTADRSIRNRRRRPHGRRPTSECHVKRTSL